MATHQFGRPRSTHHSAVLLLLCLAAACLVALALTTFGSTRDFGITGLSSASRTLNQFTAVMLTCIALIVPLTSNLYTPKLVRLYATHPLIVVGLTVLLVSHTLILATSFFPQGHAVNRFLDVAITGLFLLVMAGALPFLFGISQFLRPSFFVPMITRKGISSLAAMNAGRRMVVNGHDFFESVDVLTNLALTGLSRGDRQLVLLALQSFHVFLAEVVGSGVQGTQAWREFRPQFVPGLAREGQEYLTRERVWPEAYILAQMLKVMEMATKRQHEILAELAGRLVDTAQLALLLERPRVVELHVMAFNTLMREALDEKDLRRFQNLSYHYRLLIEAFHTAPERMHETTNHFIHYANLAAKAGLHFAKETAVYDLGELVLALARHDENRAVEIVQAWAGPLWQECIDGTPLLRKVGWRTVVRVYWEAKVMGASSLADSVFWRFLSDGTIHREQLELILDENRELHFEFNDRLMRFAHISPGAEAMARDFLMDVQDQ